MSLQFLAEDVGRLPSADQRARDDLVERNLQLAERSRFLTEAREAFRRQRTLGIVGPLLAALRSEAVADEIHLEHRHQARAPAARRRADSAIFADRRRAVRRAGTSRRAVSAASSSCGIAAT